MDSNSTDVQELIRSQLEAMSMLSRKLIAMKILRKDAFVGLEFIDLKETPSKKNFCHIGGDSSFPSSDSETKTTFQCNLEQENREQYQTKENMGVAGW